MDLGDLAPAVAALVGALAGGTIALSRFKSERAFDRRLQWYEQMTEQLNRLGATIDRMLLEVDRGRPDAARATLQEAKNLVMPFSVLAGLRMVYAKQRGFEAVQRLIDVIEKDRDKPGGEADTDYYKRMRVAKQMMWDTSLVLAEEIRDDMGWGTLRFFHHRGVPQVTQTPRS